MGSTSARTSARVTSATVQPRQAGRTCFRRTRSAFLGGAGPAAARGVPRDELLGPIFDGAVALGRRQRPARLLAAWVTALGDRAQRLGAQLARRREIDSGVSADR